MGPSLLLGSRPCSPLKPFQFRTFATPSAFGKSPAFGDAVHLAADGRFAVIVRPPLGCLSPPQRDALSAIASRHAFAGLVAVDPATCEVRGVDPELVPVVVDAVHNAGLPVAGDR